VYYGNPPHPVELIENNFLTFGIDRSFLVTENLKEIGMYYSWLSSKGIDNKLLDAWLNVSFQTE
jgi:hypothetical protein